MSLQAKSLFLAMELSKKNWKLAFGDGNRVRERSIPAGAEAALLREIEVAKEKLGLSADAPVVCGYEAGRDGFWIDRMLKKHGLKNYVMDPASIEVSRQARRRKTDRLDARKLLSVLIRGELGGERGAFSAAQVPSEAQEADLRLHRERERLVKERSGHQARIRSLLMLHGIAIKNPATVALENLRDWEGKPVVPAQGRGRAERLGADPGSVRLAAVREPQDAGGVRRVDGNAV